MLSRQGLDVHRDALNTPAFEGHNTGMIATRGARMTGVDLVPTFIEYARDAEHWWRALASLAVILGPS